MRHNEIIKIFCLTHRANFPVLLSGSKITCEEGGNKHVLSNHFPAEGNWLYCCNCRNFWLVAPEQFGMYVTQCPACGCGENARLYTCDQCNVTMVDFDDCTRHKSYNLLSWGMPQPACPGCRSFPRSAPQLHECAVLHRTVASARADCVFCAETQAANNGEAAQHFTNYLAAKEAREFALQPEAEKDAPLPNTPAPIALAAPPANGHGNGNGYKRNGAHGRELGRDRHGQAGLPANRNHGAANKSKANGRSEESRQSGKPEDPSHTWRDLETKRATLEALTQEAETKLRAAEDRQRQIEQREAELRHLTEEQERRAAERETQIRAQAKEQARTLAARETELPQAEVSVATNVATSPSAAPSARESSQTMAALPADLPRQTPTLAAETWPASPAGDAEAQLTKAELDRQLEEEWARIEVEIKRAESERKARNAVGFQRTISPPNRPALKLEKIRDNHPTKAITAPADEPKVAPGRTHKSNAQLNLKAAPLAFTSNPALEESAPLNLGESFGLSGSARAPLADFGTDNSATRRNLLVGYLVIALVLLAMLFGLGGFAFYLFHHSS